MYLPFELDPADTPLYAVVHVTRATGARHITLITTDVDTAERAAQSGGGYVLEISRIADFR